MSVERETFPELLATGALLRGVVDTSYWLDLGTPAAFVRGSADLVLGKVDSPAVPGPTGDALLLPGATVHPGAVLSGGTVVSADAVVEAGAIVEGSVILPGAVIGPDTLVKDSIVGAFATVGDRSALDGAVIGDGAIVESDNELPSGIRIACGTLLPVGAVRTTAGPGGCPAGTTAAAAVHGPSVTAQR